MSLAHEDIRHMRHALTLARRGVGQVAPNPAVGCVIVKDGSIVGRGWTQPGGRPHAETVALDAAGKAAQGATAYVTLEPCAHHGKTPPCAEALVKAGIKRVVVATGDPDRRVSGRGFFILTSTKIDVETDVCAAEAKEINAGFLSVINKKRPWITAKIATSMDGHTATAGGESKWITNALARQHGHRLRATSDAILVGVGTLKADDPRLDCRLKGLESRSPLPIILDSRLEAPLDAYLIRQAGERGTCLVTDVTDKNRLVPYQAIGVKLIQQDKPRDIRDLMRQLARELGITRLLIEGGSQVLAAFLKADMIDEIYHYRSGKILGQNSLNAFADLHLPNLKAAPTYELADVRSLSGDSLSRYRRKYENV